VWQSQRRGGLQLTNTPLQAFYNREYEGDRYAGFCIANEHPFYPVLTSFLDTYCLHQEKCLEIGCGRGAFQHIVQDYTGIDIAESVATYLQKPFYRASATDLPFADGSFGVIWSYAVLEHVEDPERALDEIRRVLKPGGFLLLLPAWQCRPWAADGYSVRPFSDFALKGKLIKASIPIRNSVVYRSLRIMPTRLFRLLAYWRRPMPTRFRYGSLKPNYEEFWMPDSDALNSMDPFEAYLWFVSRQDTCMNYQSIWSALFVRTGPLVFRRAQC
jgi:SAM-dependent methyltransferase